jgi:hypothetical protein
MQRWGRRFRLPIPREYFTASKPAMPEPNRRWGEGDDMTFIDDETKPAINGTGSEDYFLGSWDFGGQFGAAQFAHPRYGAPLIENPERTGGRYCCGGTATIR